MVHYDASPLLPGHTEDSASQSPCSRSRLCDQFWPTKQEQKTCHLWAEVVTAPAWPSSLVAQSWQMWSRSVEMAEPQTRAARITELPGRRKLPWRVSWPLHVPLPNQQGQPQGHTYGITQDPTLCAKPSTECPAVNVLKF